MSGTISINLRVNGRVVEGGAYEFHPGAVQGQARNEREALRSTGRGVRTQRDLRV